MASDFGDESGQKLLDDFVRFGQEAGIERMRERAYAVRRACDRARAGALAEAGQQDAPWAEPREWAKLDMREFQGIEGYERIKGVIETKLSAHGAECHWHADAESGKEYLLFKIKDAREVWASFGELSQEAGEACEKAAEKVAGLERGGEARAAADRAPARGGASSGPGGKARPDAARGGGRADMRREDGAPAARGERAGWVPEARDDGTPAGAGRVPGGKEARSRARKGDERADGGRRKRGAPAHPDERPLDERAEHARAASAALEGARAAARARAREPRMQEVRSK